MFVALNRRRAALSARRRCGALLTALLLCVGLRPTLARACVGDCDGDGIVTVSELVTAVSIALGTAALSACTAIDTNGDGIVTINELIAAVSSALVECAGGPSITLTGSCEVPGHGDRGLQPCAAGTPITVFRCDDRSQCLHQQGLTMIGSGTVADNGGWALQVAPANASAALVLQASVANAVVYRALAFGSVGGLLRIGAGRAASYPPIDITPVTEAAVQLLDNNGLANYPDTGAQQVVSAVEQATTNLSFEGDTPDMAVSIALQTAGADPTVMMVLQTARNMPTATPTQQPTPSPSNMTTIVWSENFDDGNGNDRWAADSVWQIGSPSIGPEVNSAGYRTHSGPYCATTGLTTNYPQLADARFYRLQSFTVPSAAQYPRLRFWHWFTFPPPTGGAADYGVVEVKVVGSDTWQAVSTQYYYIGGDWTYASVDFSAFAGQLVQVGFHLVGESFNSAQGWYVDDIALETGAPVFNNPEGWENGIGDWSAEQGLWQVGSPTKGNGAPLDALGFQCHEGSNCASTLLAEGYPACPNPTCYPQPTSRLVSPPFTVPPASTNPSLRFWHWYSLGPPTGGAGDWAVVEIRAGSNTWEPLPDCSGSTVTYTLNSGSWSEPCYDLSSYSEQTVQLAFHLSANSFSGGAGWYVDDIQIVTH